MPEVRFFTFICYTEYIIIFKAGIERELASRADQGVLRWFAMWKELMSILCPEGC